MECLEDKAELVAPQQRALTVRHLGDVVAVDEDLAGREGVEPGHDNSAAGSSDTTGPESPLDDAAQRGQERTRTPSRRS